MDDDDPRLAGQESYLTGITLSWREWWSSRPPDKGGEWDHDHCEFCWKHLSDHILADDPDTQLAGFAPEDGSLWICRDCFEDFNERFNWVGEGDVPSR